MKLDHRIIAYILFVTSALLIVLGYVLSHPETVGLCVGGSSSCITQPTLFGVGHPLYLGTRWLPFFFFFLIFVPREIFVSWAKFAWWIALIGLLFIIGSPPIGNAIHLTPDRTQMTQFVTHLFVIVSLLWIGWKYWRLRRKTS